jgi:hypothetical protein
MMVFFASCLPVIILMCGMAIDVGLLQMTKLRMQNAADSAAIAAEMEAERGTGNWVAEAKADASVNGFTDGVNNVTIAVGQQPSGGAYSGQYDALYVTVTKTMRTVFMGALNHGDTTMSATAVAIMTPCTYLLGTGTLGSYTPGYSLDVDTGDLDGNTCPVDINARMVVASAANMAVEAINVTGASGNSSNSGSVYPTPVFGSANLTDPLAYLSSPSFSSCTTTSYNLTSGSATLNPGTYCKGLNISNASVTLNPGLYIITGGATWSNATVTGSGVTLFFTTGGGGSYGQFSITNNSTVTISAPTVSSNNSIPAILVFGDRNWVASGNQDFQCHSSTFTGDGIWYIKKAGYWFQSCGTFTGTNYFGIVADNIYTDGTSIVPKNNYSFVQTGNPLRTGAVVVQ